MKKRVVEAKKSEVVKDAPFAEKGGDGPTAEGWHSIESFLRCPKEYQFEKVRGVHVPSNVMPDYFAIGILLHVAKGMWFSKRFRTDDATMKTIHAAIHKTASTSKKPIRVEAIQLALRYFTEYVEHYKIRPLPHAIAAEHYIKGTLKTDAGYEETRTARLDDVSTYPEAGGKLCIGESKTTSTSIQDLTTQYTLHGQPLLQLALWEASPDGKAKYGDVAGVMLDGIVKGYGKTRSKFGRVFMPKPNEKTMEWFIKNLLRSVAAAKKVDWNTEVPRNITMCTRLVGRARVSCPYLKLCQHGRAASSQYVLEGGKSMLDWKAPGRVVPPWE